MKASIAAVFAFAAGAYVAFGITSSNYKTELLEYERKINEQKTASEDQQRIANRNYNELYNKWRDIADRSDSSDRVYIKADCDKLPSTGSVDDAGATARVAISEEAQRVIDDAEKQYAQCAHALRAFQLTFKAVK